MLNQPTKITCTDSKHQKQTATCICFNEFCQSNRIYCFQCYQQGQHVGHLRDVHQISDLPVILQNQSEDCEQLINSFQDSLNKAQELLNQLALALRQRYSITETQVSQLSARQLEQVINEMVKWKAKKETLNQQIEKNTEALFLAYNSCIQEVGVCQLVYCTITPEKICQSSSQKNENEQSQPAFEQKMQYQNKKDLLTQINNLEKQIKILNLKVNSQTEKDSALAEHLKINVQRYFQSILQGYYYLNFSNTYETSAYCFNLIKITKFESSQEEVQKIIGHLTDKCKCQKNMLGKVISILK